MSTSDIDPRRGRQNPALKTAFVYLLVSLFCVFFGAVYEVFSHEVYSYYMIYAFVFPLAGGTLPFLALALFGPRKPVAGSLYHAGIAALTISSILRGVLDIYGTSNHLIKGFWILGIVLTVIGAIPIIMKWKTQSRN